MTRPIELIDCSLRDGHQSLLATRMSTAQAMRVLPLLKQAGYTTLELWGGATLDAALRFTGDDPWERLDAFRQMLGGRVSIRSLCRGQNLFAYSPYADRVVYTFIKHAVRGGNDRIRIFDALNDPTNLTTAIMTAKTFDGLAEVALSYTTSPVHDVAHFLRFVDHAVDQGADALAIKDMAGLLDPAVAAELVRAIKAKHPDRHLTLHSHCTNGLAIASYAAAMLAGVDAVDVCHGPMAGSTAQPPAELICLIADELGLTTGLDRSLFPEIDHRLRGIREELVEFDAVKDGAYGGPWPQTPSDHLRDEVRKLCALVREGTPQSYAAAVDLSELMMTDAGYPPTDKQQLAAQIPGGMISNLRTQLEKTGTLANLPRILEEVPRVRAESGYVPLVTPTSQIVGTQAALNVNSGQRYSLMSKEFINMVTGRYGRLPGPVDPDLLAKARAQAEPVPPGGARSDDPDLSRVYAEFPNLIHNERELLLCLLFPQPARALLTKRYPAARA